MRKDDANRYRRQVSDVLANASTYHDAYYEAETFRGPSLYFHRRCIALSTEPLTVNRLECIYATLASWGMHRMGRGGSKMRPFGEFQQSVVALSRTIDELKHVKPETVAPEDWACLGEVFLGIRVMATGTSLVGNSKVMAHLVPNIVPPIDREYTLRLLRGSMNIQNDPHKEWLLMKGLMEGFFLPVARDPRLRALAGKWMADQDRYPWDTSLMKVIDNLLIGARKAQG
jgi:hypothetical protein